MTNKNDICFLCGWPTGGGPDLEDEDGVKRPCCDDCYEEETGEAPNRWYR